MISMTDTNTAKPSNNTILHNVFKVKQTASSFKFEVIPIEWVDWLDYQVRSRGPKLAHQTVQSGLWLDYKINIK